MSKAVIRPISIGLKKDSTKSAFLSHLEPIDKEIEEGNFSSQSEQDSFSDSSKLFQFPVLNKYKHLIVDLKKKLPPREAAWSIDINEEKFRGGTKGNFSVIIGKAKSKKTGLVSLIVSQYVKENPGKLVLYFDTEQDEHDSQRIGFRYAEHTQNDEDVILVRLREESVSERLKKIDEIIKGTDGIDLIIIDGVRDLVTSINDEEQATLINTKLLQWTGEKKTHIITVIHQNKGDNNARGHLGTELINKSELVLSVTKDIDNESQSIVKKELDRSAPDFPDFILSINDKDKVVIEGITSKKTNSQGNKKLGLKDIADHTWTNEILPRIFSKNKELKHNELVTEIKVDLESNYLGDECLSTSRGRILDYIVHIKNKGFIEKIGKERSPYAKYILPS